MKLSLPAFFILTTSIYLPALFLNTPSASAQMNHFPSAKHGIKLDKTLPTLQQVNQHSTANINEAMELLARQRAPRIVKSNPIQLADSLLLCGPQALQVRSIEKAQFLIEKKMQVQLREQMVAFAENYLGRPYRYGSQGDRGFDCSGLVNHVFTNFGMQVPRSSREFAIKGQEIPLSEAIAGDVLVFGRWRNNQWRPFHVALVVSNEPGNLSFIHAVRGGIRIDTENDSIWHNYWKKYYMHAKRFVPEYAVATYNN